MIDKSIGRYHILEQLGEGGMATVYKAFDTRLERDVAIKLLRTERLDSRKAIKRFEIEAKALAQLNHPNIVQVMDYGEHDGMPYLVMEYVPGGTLKEHLGKPVLWQHAAKLLAPIARALAYAHEKNLVHRDVKPSNILITESGVPKLADFGIAKMLEIEETLDLTGTSVGVGTPWYMSPEQGKGQKVDHRSDIYSLGIVFYELVTGRKPYQADTPMAVIYQHLQDPIPRPKLINSSLPNHVEGFLFKVMSKNPKNRYQTMAEMTEAFEEMEIGEKVKLRMQGNLRKKIIAIASGLVILGLLMAIGSMASPYVPDIIRFRSTTTPLQSFTEDPTTTEDLKPVLTPITEIPQAILPNITTGDHSASQIASSITPTPKPTLEIKPTITNTPISLLIFDEDFDDGNADINDFWEGEDGEAVWEIVKDETGDLVYEIDYMAGIDYPKAYFGHERGEGYRIKLRVRFLDFSNRSGAGCEFMVNNDGSYSVKIDPDNRRVNISYWDRRSGNSTSISSKVLQVETGKWYTIRIEVIDQKIKAYINGHLIDILSGYRGNDWGKMGLAVNPGTYAQFNDLEVYVISK